jgi:exosortase
MERWTSNAAQPAQPLVLSGILILVGLAAAYWTVMAKLLHDWGANDDYSHGFLIIPVAGYLVWERRHRLAAAPHRPTIAGLGLLLFGLAALAAGTLGAELFVARTSLIVVLAGITLFLGGWAHLRILLFPLAFLVLMIPIPMIVFNRVAFPLQLLASRLGETALWLLHIPVLRQGNIITLANTTLEVAEACSGIRSLVSLLTLSIVYAYFTEGRRSVQLLLIGSTVPIAVFTNGLRVAAIGVGAYYLGPRAVDGAFHTASGWLVFVLAFALLLLLQRTARVFRQKRRMPLPHAATASNEVRSGCFHEL